MTYTDVVVMAAIGIITAMLAVYLKRYNKEYGMLVSIAGGLAMLIFIINRSSAVMSFINSVSEVSNISGADFGILIKLLGLTYIIQFAADVCKDSGETAMAGKVELAGKFAIVLTAMPLFEEVLELVVTVLR